MTFGSDLSVIFGECLSTSTRARVLKAYALGWIAMPFGPDEDDDNSLPYVTLLIGEQPSQDFRGRHRLCDTLVGNIEWTHFSAEHIAGYYFCSSARP